MTLPATRSSIGDELFEKFAAKKSWRILQKSATMMKEWWQEMMEGEGLKLWCVLPGLRNDWPGPRTNTASTRSQGTRIGNLLGVLAPVTESKGAAASAAVLLVGEA
jgi:hypothetical protein